MHDMHRSNCSHHEWWCCCTPCPPNRLVDISLVTISVTRVVMAPVKTVLVKWVCFSDYLDRLNSSLSDTFPELCPDLLAEYIVEVTWRIPSSSKPIVNWRIKKICFLSEIIWFSTHQSYQVNYFLGYGVIVPGS